MVVNFLLLGEKAIWAVDNVGTINLTAVNFLIIFRPV